jgi:hypothetical protein
MKEKTFRLAEIFGGKNDNSEVYTSDAKYRKKRQSQGQFSKLPHLFDFFSLHSDWEKLTGKMIAKNSIPLKIKNDVLLVLVKHSVFSTELSYMQDEIIKKIHRERPSLKKQFHKIKFITSPQTFSLLEEQLKNQREKKQKIELPHKFSPLYQSSLREAQEMFGEIEDQEIFDSFFKLYLQLKNK